jgi:hypothetical protein
MTDRLAVRVVAALRPDDLVDLGFHQLMQHPQPDADRQRQHAFLRCRGELAERLQHRRRQRVDVL